MVYYGCLEKCFVFMGLCVNHVKWSALLLSVLLLFAGLTLGCACCCSEDDDAVVVREDCCASPKFEGAGESSISIACNCMQTCQKVFLIRQIKGEATIIEFRQVDSALSIQRSVGQFSGCVHPEFSDTVGYTAHSNGFVQAIQCCFIC